MTLIKTFPSWDPDAVRAAAAPAIASAPADDDRIIDSTDRLHMDVSNTGKLLGATIETFQEIPDSFLRDMADKKTMQDGMFAPDEVHVCTVPVGLVDQWIREGFNIYADQNITPAMIVARLKAEDMSKFVLTSKIG
jgi:hypothetical protein